MPTELKWDDAELIGIALAEKYPLLNPLEVGGIARNQFQAIVQGNGGNHRIGRADGLADVFQLEKNNVAVRLHRIRLRLQEEMER